MRSFRPNLTLVHIRSVLTGTALDVIVKYPNGATVPGTAGWDRDSGYGIVMADTALAKLASTTVGLASNVTSLSSLQTATLTATVTPVVTPNTPVPTNSVTFADGSSSIGTFSLSGGAVSLPLTGLAPGGHTITVVYNGDSNYPAGYAGASNVVTLNVDNLLTDASAKVSVKRGVFVYNRASNTYTQKVTLTASAAVSSPVSLILSSLTNASLTSAAGTTSLIAPAGRPYVNVASLTVGTPVTLTLTFQKTGAGSITYGTQVVAGPGTS